MLKKKVQEAYEASVRESSKPRKSRQGVQLEEDIAFLQRGGFVGIGREKFNEYKKTLESKWLQLYQKKVEKLDVSVFCSPADSSQQFSVSDASDEGSVKAVSVVSSLGFEEENIGIRNSEGDPELEKRANESFTDSSTGSRDSNSKAEDVFVDVPIDDDVVFEPKPKSLLGKYFCCFSSLNKKSLVTSNTTHSPIHSK